MSSLSRSAQIIPQGLRCTFVRRHITKGESNASVTSKLRVLQQRPPARISGSTNLFFRVHVLRFVC